MVLEAEATWAPADFLMEREILICRESGDEHGFAIAGDNNGGDRRRLDNRYRNSILFGLLQGFSGSRGLNRLLQNDVISILGEVAPHGLRF